MTVAHYGFSRFGAAASTRRRHRWIIPDSALRWGWPKGCTPFHCNPMVAERVPRYIAHRQVWRITGFTNP